MLSLIGWSTIWLETGSLQSNLPGQRTSPEGIFAWSPVKPGGPGEYIS